MKVKVNKLFKNLISKLGISIKRFPEAILVAVLGVMVMILINHLGFEKNKNLRETLTRIDMIFALAIPIFLNIKIYIEKKMNSNKLDRIVLDFMAAVILILYYMFLLKDTNFVSITRYGVFTIALYLLFLILPQVKSKDSYEMYVIFILNRFIVTYVYSFILYGGVSAIIFTANLLFKLNISGRLFFDLLSIILWVFAPMYFLADITVNEFNKDVSKYPKFLRILLLYIIMPIICAYTVILYLYCIKTIVSVQWPISIILHLILWYSIICTAVIFFIYPLKSVDKWVNNFIRFFPKIILPIMIMMFVAIGLRINHYGITEGRYMVALIGLWVFGIMIYFSLVKNIKSIMLPISLAIIIVLSVVGPWSFYSVSKASQQSRFNNILNKYNMIKNGLIVKPQKDISISDKQSISSIVLFFNDKYSLRELNYVPSNFTIDKMEQVFGFPLTYEVNNHYSDGSYFNYFASNNNLFNIQGYDYYANLSSNNLSTVNLPEKSIEISYIPEETKVKIMKHGKEIYSKNLEENILKIYNNNKSNKELSKEYMVIYDENKNVKVIIIFKEISGVKNTLGKIKIENLEFSVFAKF